MVTRPLSCLVHILLFCALFANAGDVDLLITFKNSLPDPNMLSNWNRTNAMCQFQGITCKTGHVSSLMIRDLTLTADFNSVSAYILPLPNLETLTLQSTNLTGSISNPANCSAQLKELDISNNGLNGSVSDAVSLADSCPSLQSLNLSDNFIGHAFHSFPPVRLRIKMLDLSYNNIVSNSDLQWLFSNLGLLKNLDLSNNNIQGNMPPIFNCTSLQHLDMSTNQLIGTVPSEIKACTSLVALSLSYNNFSGEIPILPLPARPRLEHLDLAFNNFNGSLPKYISNLTSLEFLDLSANKLSGQIPHSLCTDGVSSLKLLYLQDNFLTGHIPNLLSNCSNLNSLDVSFNLLSGPIPSSLGSLSKLKFLQMWHNNLNGEIPGQLSSLRSLRNLVLDYNNLTGAIPDGLVNCTNLNWISLGSNRLTGSIPNWIGRLQNIGILVLRNNSFTGMIPPELGNCKGLVYLELSRNQLNGSIPPALAKQSGKIVADLVVTGWPLVMLADNLNIQCQHEIIILDASGIRYDDLVHMPSTHYCNFLLAYQYLTGDLSKNNKKTMVFIDLSYNQLTGHIPTEVSTMKCLLVLNLHHNQLSGPLPQELGGLHYLFVLYLSHNMFDGMIPSSFSELSLQDLDLSNNRLSGPIPQWGSLATHQASAFENNSGLCGLPLPPCSSGSMSKDNMLQKSSTNHESSWGWWVALWILFTIFFIIGFAIGQFII